MLSCLVPDLIVAATVELFTRVSPVACIADRPVVVEGTPLGAVEIESFVFEPICEHHSKHVVGRLENAHYVLVTGGEAVIEL